jgi:UDP-N-acetylmuramyl pentapeptide phosphotransferase/UDP-N-acetylglucosamine-1-phosphate transferase
LVFKANVKITSLYGIFGIYAIPEFASIILSIFTIIVIINAFNLIDGINGLSGSIGTLISVILGSWFFLIDRLEIAIVAFSLAGSLVAFLKYNVSPAKIFMGDTGSLLLGIVCAILTIQFIELHQDLAGSPYAFKSAPSVAIGILILPLFDTLRVFTMRIIRGRSPFLPDRNHIHHLLLDSGLTHMQSTAVLVGVNILFIIMAVKLQGIGNLYLLFVIFAVASGLTFLLFIYARQKRIKRNLTSK